MTVLLSIKPEYAEKIFQGEKRYEYRKRLFKRKDINRIIVYSTMPVGKVIGEFEINEIIEGSPISIWTKTKEYSGINKKNYTEYFRDKKTGFAISIKNVTVYKTPLDLKELNPNIKCAPQSFMYI